jgi:hypothetical protein
MNQMPPSSGQRKRSVVESEDVWEEEEVKRGF